MSSDISFEEIAKDVPTIELQQGKVQKSFSSIGARGAQSYIAAQRFSEVYEAFNRCRTLTEMARETGLSAYYLKKYFFDDPKFSGLLKKSNEVTFLNIVQNRESLEERRARAAEDALDEMERLMHESENEHIRFKASQDLLDRDPRISRTKRLEGSAAPVTVNFEMIQVAVAAAREVDASKKPIDAEAKGEG